MGHPSPRSGKKSPLTVSSIQLAVLHTAACPTRSHSSSSFSRQGLACSTAQHNSAAGPTVLLSPGAIFQCFSSHGEMLCLLCGMSPYCHFCLTRGHAWHYHTFPVRSETHTASGGTFKILCQCWLGAHRDRLAQPGHSLPWHRDHLQLRQSISTEYPWGAWAWGRP